MYFCLHSAMPVYRIYRTDGFINHHASLTNVEKERINRFVYQLTEKGPTVGKPLGYLFFREKKFDGKRMFFLIYAEWQTILLADVTDKKEQASTINEIRNELPLLKEFVRQKLLSDEII